MSVSLTTPSYPSTYDSYESASARLGQKAEGAEDDKLRDALDQFVGETFYGMMLKSMRKTVGKPAYFHGGRAEEVFQQQLDQVLAEKLTAASSEQLTEPMYQLMSLQRRS